MNCYYDRKDFMVGHVFSEYYKYYISMPHLRGVWEEKKSFLLILTNWEIILIACEVLE